MLAHTCFVVWVYDIPPFGVHKPSNIFKEYDNVEAHPPYSPDLIVWNVVKSINAKSKEPLPPNVTKTNSDRSVHAHRDGFIAVYWENLIVRSDKGLSFSQPQDG
jgi:hypothetical protein